MTRRIPSVVVAVAATLGLALVTPIGFSAGAGATTAPRPPASLSSFSFSSARLLSTRPTGVHGRIALGKYPAAEIGTLRAVYATVTVNGRARGEVQLMMNGFNYPSSWGAGTVRLGPVRWVGRTKSVTVPEYSNVFTVRQGVRGSMVPHRAGSKVTFRIRSVAAFTGASWQPMRTAVVQYWAGSRWRTLRTVRLDARGNRTFTVKKKAKRIYRLTVPTSRLVDGNSSRGQRV